MNNADSFFFLKEHKNFLNSKIYKEIKKDFTHLFLDIHNDNNSYTYSTKFHYHRQEQFDKSTLHYSALVYLNSIIKESHKKIADVGCGYNFLKKYFPKITGYDQTEFADYYEFFNEEFISKYLDEFDVAIAINSLHFIPLKDFSSRINDFGKIIKPGGYGFMTFNLQRMVERTDKKFLENYNSIEDFYNYINQEIKKIKYKVDVFDNTLLYNVKLIDIKRQNLYNKLKGSDWPSYVDIINNSFSCDNHEILSEIKQYTDLLKYFRYEDAKEDYQNGNIRLIFRKEDK